MEPRIQYAKTSDGVNSAYSAVGDSAPLVHLPVLFDSHLVLDAVRVWLVLEA